MKLCNSHRHHSANYTNIIIDFSSSAEQVSNPPFEVSECDTAKLLIGQENLKHLSRDHIYKILKTEPDSNASSYPCTWTSASRSFRQFQPSLMKKFPWLHYSPYVDEAYCCACVLFDCREAGGGHVLGHFVTLRCGLKCLKRQPVMLKLSIIFLLWQRWMSSWHIMIVLQCQ